MKIKEDEVMEDGRDLLANSPTTGRLQLEPDAAVELGERQSSRLLSASDMVDVVVVAGGQQRRRRRGQPKGSASDELLQLHRKGRQVSPESTEMLSSSRVDHAVDVICFSCLCLCL